MSKTTWRVAVAALAIGLVPIAGSQAQYTRGGSSPSVTNEADTRGMTTTTSAPHTSSSPSSGTRVRPELAKPLQEAVTLNNAQDYAGAMAKIREADAAATDKTPQEEYVVAKFLGSVALHLNDHATALAAFNRAIASNAVPPDEKPNMLYITMVLNAEQKNFAQAVALGEQLQALGPLDEKSAVGLAQSYYNNGQYPQAIKVAQAALAAGVTDPQNKAALLEVQTKGEAQMGNQAGAAASLESQCAEMCDGKSWGQLVGITMSKIYGLTDHLALNLFRLKMMAGGMELGDYITMATLDLGAGLPAEAKTVLERGIAAGIVHRSGRAAELLGKATTQAAADARSLPAFEREAAAKANGEEDVKLGEFYFTHGQLAEAETALRRGLGKSGVHDRADAQMTLGIVLLAEGKKEDAVAAFGSASSSSTQAPAAHLWTLYANRKG